MKRIIIAISFLVLVLSTAPTFAQYLSSFLKTPNAAISGYNDRHLSNVSPAQCAQACLQEKSFNCQSFDYYKYEQACDLSSKKASDVGGLKTNYSGNPYDHYSLSAGSLPSSHPATTSDSLDGQEVFTNWNRYGCDFTNASTFTITSPKEITGFRVWYNWKPGEETIEYALYNGQQYIGKNIFRKGSCDSYQKNWCQGVSASRYSLSSGTYTIRTSKGRICQNTQSNLNGFVSVYAR